MGLELAVRLMLGRLPAPGVHDLMPARSRRALRAALDMQLTFARLNRELRTR